MAEEKTRVYLESVIEDSDLLDMVILEQKLSVAQDTLQKSKFPEEDKQKEVNIYQAALNLMSEVLVFRKRWFEMVNKKHNLPPNSSIELDTGRIFIEKLVEKEK